MPRSPAAVLGVLLALCLSGSAFAETFRYVVMANGEKVGRLAAEVVGRTTSVDYKGPERRTQGSLQQTG